MSTTNRILVTGSAGFIGFHLSMRLLFEGHQVIGLDNLNDYYDVNLKHDRLALLEKMPNFSFVRMGLEEREALHRLCASGNFDVIINLAAQAGVRYSLTHPYAYIDSNINGFINILEACRTFGIKHLVYASSSSVYGANTTMPFSVHHNVDHPLSLYAATKKANELMAHTYSSLYGIPTTGLRFFTVYGPWGRPDMAYFSFTKAILEGKPIEIFNHGRMQRDFTYVDDIIEGLVRVIDTIPQPDSSWNGSAPDPGNSYAPKKIYNIGNNRPVELVYFIEVLESCLGRQAIKKYLPMQAGDVPATFADIDDLTRDTGFKPSTTIEEGIGRFVEWYLSYYRP
jgi:UDP-glucuronate 4-epimerase